MYFVFKENFRQRFGVLNIDFVESKIRELPQRLKPEMFQTPVIVIADIINTDNIFATGQKFPAYA
jgi:hypothetical protein